MPNLPPPSNDCYRPSSIARQVLKWCRENGCPWGGGTCANAAEGGHFEVLKWCRENGCPWTEATCTLAAREGQFEILRWCRENGCSWGASTFR